ncbi:hypothetical protein ES319_A07G127500v1 [Gossypium barbadense]|uniref:Brix domain-containing protein n=3 Tax=Gossypium TaxID=3633 RepID=A0A5J5V2M2_GOSBA|nr:hypothetical protein ES319_A07G127500v1 [Gossypium barbadense]
MFSRGKLLGPLRRLQMDLRKLMLPYTALKLKEKKRNNLNDFLNVAGPMGVTHFLVLSKIKTSPVLRVAKTPQGPTLNCALIVLFGFAAADEQLRLTTMVFKNIFPDIDINTVKLSSCQRIVLINYNKNVSSLHPFQARSQLFTKKDRSVGEAGTSALLDDSWFSSDSFLHCFCKDFFSLVQDASVVDGDLLSWTRKLKELLENSLGWEFQQKSAVDGIYFEENDEYAPVVEMLDEPSGSEPTS